MKIEPLGDRAYILRDLEEPAYLVARAINAKLPVGVIEAVASYETVALYVDADIVDTENLFLTAAKDIQPKHHVIPVCYEMGEDLELAASRLGVRKEQLIKEHSGTEYRCYALGFCPGFAYLGYLPEVIAGLPRLDVPRLKVPPGSVAITGRQTAVYPLERPGGWWLIGRTPLELVAQESQSQGSAGMQRAPQRPEQDLEMEPQSQGRAGMHRGPQPGESADYFPIEAGDLISFTPIDREEFEARKGERL